MPACDVADRLEVAGLRGHQPEHHRRLEDDAGGFASFGGEALDASLHRRGVVERNGDGQVRDRPRDPRAVRALRRVERVVRVSGSQRDHDRVVMAVVGPEDLHDDLSTREAARDPDRVHRRLGPRVGEAPLGQAPAARELLADDDRILRRRGEVRSAVIALLQRAADGGVRVALHHRPEPAVEVGPPRSVDVPQPRAPRTRHVERPGIGELVARRNTADQDLSGAAVHRARRGRAAREPALLAADQTAQIAAIDAGKHRVGT
jgi:hypothetical protein